MTSTKGYLEFILEQLSGLDGIEYRPMMGEYLLYYRGKLFGGIYDDRLLIKPVPSVRKSMPEARMEVPYEGARELVLAENVDNREFLCQLIEEMWEELPSPKRKRTKSR